MIKRVSPGRKASSGWTFARGSLISPSPNCGPLHCPRLRRGDLCPRCPSASSLPTSPRTPLSPARGTAWREQCWLACIPPRGHAGYACRRAGTEPERLNILSNRLSRTSPQRHLPFSLVDAHLATVLLDKHIPEFRWIASLTPVKRGKQTVAGDQIVSPREV